ncbi:MAG TPA: alpha/beta hydrolase [Pyrinomonadaceae bacterium]|nr:alpha/beta hydrolase [Pyrinomonadaceae bacterium]
MLDVPVQAGLKVASEARGRVCGDGIELTFGYWPGRGAPVVALHGLTASYLNFIGVAERLEGRRSLLALDLRGRGDSDKPDGPYGLAQHARDVAAAMRAFGLGPSIIVGHSMGAFIATALAAQDPELVAGLILIDGGYLLDMPVGADAEQVLDSVLAQRITQLQATYPSREVYLEFWRSRPNFPAADWGPWTEAFLSYEVGGEAPLLRPKASEAAVRFDVAESFRVAEITARLEALQVPVMLLRAAAGFALDRPQLIPDPAVEQMRAILPELADETIPGTTHYTIVLGERGASRVADVIDEFTQKCI